uniref:Uncharacterized protein n=1 Tax=Megaselia scalaris TaxID=36166 RepID=T1GP53_MEGSC
MDLICAANGQNFPSRKYFFTSPNGYQKKGRPRTRWSDAISRDARTIGIPNWRTTAKNREVWKAAIDKAELITKNDKYF